MKVIIHADADDMILGVRAVKLCGDLAQGAFMFGEGDAARAAHARMNPSGSWTVWVHKANAIQVVPV